MASDKTKKKKDKNKDNEKRSHFYDPSRGLHRLLPCIFITLAVLLGVFYALNFTGTDSAVSEWIAEVLTGLFGYSAYALPALLLIIGIRWHSDVVKKRAISRVIYSFIFVVLVQAIVWCFAGPEEDFSAVAYYESGISLDGAGFIGGAVGRLLYVTTNYIGVPLFSTAFVIMFFCHFLAITPVKVWNFLRGKKGEDEETENSTEAYNDENFEDFDAVAEESGVLTTEDETAPAREDEHKMTRKEKREQKRAAKEAKKRGSYEGYFPEQNPDESFDDIRRRLEEEAMEIERERANGATSSTIAVLPEEETVPLTTPAAVNIADDYFTDEAPVTHPTVQPTVETTSPGAVPAQRADALFGSFDPLSGDAVINTTSTILRPAGVPNEVRREAVRPMRTQRPEYHTVPGGIQGQGGSVGSFYIHPTPHRAPTPAETPVETTPVAESAATPVETPAAPPATDTPGARPLSDFELLTRRTDNEIQTPAAMPYVHPATHPGTQPQPQPPAGYPYGMPYGQPGYPPAYPAGYPAQPYMGYPASPYQPYPYPPISGQPYPTQPMPGYGAQTPPIQPEAILGATAAQQVSPQPPSAQQAPVQQPPLPTEADTETPVVATSHVAEHNVSVGFVPTEAPASPARQVPAAPKEEPKRNVPTYDNYLFPPISLLKHAVPITNMNSEAETRETAERLVGEFRKFKHNVEVKEITVGPRVTRYSIVPPDGVRINTLINLANDIALGLAVKSIRIDPVPNTPYLGVEIPNRSSTTVHLSSLIDTENFRNTKTVTTIPIGASVTGQPVFADIAKMPHVLIAGATGMGKSVFVNSLLISLLYKAKPNEVKLILVDPKRVELSVYNGIPHLLIPPVVEPQKAAGALIWAVGEMERRYHLMEKYGMRNIEGYNNAVLKDPSLGDFQPKIIIVIDELNDLMMQARDAVEPAIMSIAQKARAAGIHLILGTQRPSVDVITGVIKANIPSRIAFHVSSGTDSRTILDFYGAEKLLNNGDMLAAIAGAEAIRVQGAFVADEEVENVTSFLKQNAGPAVYDEIVNAQIESETEKYKNSGKRQSDREMDDEDLDGSIFEDSKFMEACNIALESGKISTSLLQRRCSIGYGKAAKYIDIMQSMGIVSAPDGQKPREVLMGRDQFMEMVSRESYTGD